MFVWSKPSDNNILDMVKMGTWGQTNFTVVNFTEVFRKYHHHSPRLHQSSHQQTTQSRGDSVTSIKSRASCDAKKIHISLADCKIAISQ